MELRVLHYFLTVAREQSITRAAQSLHLSQPTLSRQLMDLEAEIGKPLLIRGSRQIALTEEGMLLRKRAQEILDLVAKTENELAVEETVAGDIYIGAGETDGDFARPRSRCSGSILVFIAYQRRRAGYCGKTDKRSDRFRADFRRSRFFRLFNAGAACQGSLGRVIAPRSSAGPLLTEARC